MKYDLPNAYNEQELVKTIAKHYSLKKEASVIRKLAYFDTFDWRLYNNSLVLYESQKELFLYQPDNSVQSVKITSSPVFIQDFPEGSTIKTRLAPVIDMRALLRLAEVRVEHTPYRILNNDEKTVAWLILEKMAPTSKNEASALPLLHVSVKAVRGYADFEAVAAQLQAIDCTPTNKDTYFLAMELVRRQPGDYSSKLNIQLDPAMRADEAAKILLRSILEVMKRNQAYIKEDVDTEFLHDFRVAVRRTRSALSQIINVFPEETVARYKQGFSFVSQISNDLRDLDVYLLAETSYRAMLPDILRDDIAPLFDYLRKQREKALKQVVDGLNSSQYAIIIADWEAFLDEPVPVSPQALNAARPIIDLARERIYRYYRRIVRKGQDILANVEDEKLHALRIECKKLRYLLEFFTGLFPAKEISILTGQLKKLQDNLGSFNDLCMQEEYLITVAQKLPLADQQTRKTLLAVGGLVDTLHQKRIRVKNEFAGTFTAFTLPVNKKRFKQLFAPVRKAVIL